jgi:hypothetical protein
MTDPVAIPMAMAMAKPRTEPETKMTMMTTNTTKAGMRNTTMIAESTMESALIGDINDSWIISRFEEFITSAEDGDASLI